MKYSFVALALTGSVFAASSDTAKDITSNVQAISDAVAKFDSAIKAYTGGSADTLMAASKAIGAATAAANSKINGDDVMVLNDAVGIQPAVGILQTNLQNAMDSLVNAKTKLVAANQGCQVQKELDTQGVGASALQKTITSKVPADMQVLATKLSGGITDAINKGVDAYKDTCAGGSAPSGPSGSSSGSGSGSGSSSGSGAAGGSGSTAPHGNTAGHSGSSGSPSTPGSTTSTGPKPAVWTGAASSLSAPALLAIAVAMVAL